MALATPTAAATPQALTLSEATQRALAQHPELKVFHSQFDALKAQRTTANLRPGYELGVDLENFAGSGERSGLDSAELTVSLSSVIELGDKRSSRVAVAESRYAMAQAEREAKALDLLGLVTQRFVSTLSLQHKLRVAREATRLAQQSLDLVKARVSHGAAPEAERLRAQAMVKQTEIHESALAAALTSEKFALASLWGADNTDFHQVNGHLFAFESAASFNALYQRVADSPAIQVFASETRLRDAEVALARSRSSSNVKWNVGVRRYEGTGDSALTAGVSVPLFAERRNSGDEQAAVAEREAIRYQREAALLAVRTRLFEAWQSYQHSANAARQMRADVLPALEQALSQTQQAYERGRYSYVDWMSAQRELLDARMEAIDAATTALLNQALIEQLTAEPLAADSDQQAVDQANESPQR